MGVAGNDGFLVAFGEANERDLERANPAAQPLARVAQPQAKVERHLVVPAAGGVELRPWRSDALRKFRLDVHVHILEVLTELKFPRLDLRADFEQPCFDLAEFLWRENAGA